MELRLGEKIGKKQKVYVDGEYRCALYPSEIKQYDIDDRTEIGEEELERLMTDTVLLRAKRRVLNILLKSDKTEAELRRKLKENLYTEETADAVIAYVNGYHYIDELRIAESYIRSKMYESSEKEIRYRLEGKGVDENTIDKAYEIIIEELNFKWRNEEPDTEFRNPEEIAAERFLRKRLGSCMTEENGNDRPEVQKAVCAAYRKGFSVEIINKIIKNLHK